LSKHPEEGVAQECRNMFNGLFMLGWVSLDWTAICYCVRLFVLSWTMLIVGLY